MNLLELPKISDRLVEWNSVDISIRLMSTGSHVSADSRLAPLLCDSPNDNRTDPIAIRGGASAVGRFAALIETDRFDTTLPRASGPIDVVDLFCGCGGLSCGFEIVGRLLPSFKLAAAVDFDHWAASTYLTNLGLQPLVSDLAAVMSSDAELENLLSSLPLRKGAPLVLVGGPPCQGFSAHRKKNGRLDDPRNDLVGAFARIAERLLPDLVVMENVPELLSRSHWNQAEALRSMLERAGYTVRSQIHNLAKFGVPQERFRALIVAAKKPFQMPAGILSIGDFRTVRDAIGSLPPVLAGVQDTADAMHVSARHRRSTVNTIRRVPIDGGRRPVGVGPACLDRVDGFRDVYGRMFWDRPANTITGYARNPASGRYVHPDQHRGLTIREAALLQGFPRRFMFEGPFDHRFMQIGNAVPPVFAAYLAAHLLGELLVEEDHETEHSRIDDVALPTSDSFSSGIAGRKQGSRCR